MRDPKRVLSKILGKDVDLAPFEASGEDLLLLVEILREISKIRKLRQESGGSQENLAHESGLAKRTVEYVEAGKRVTPKTVWLIARALNVETSELIRDDDISAPPAPPCEAEPTATRARSTPASVGPELVADRYDSGRVKEHGRQARSRGCGVGQGLLHAPVYSFIRPASSKGGPRGEPQSA